MASVYIGAAQGPCDFSRVVAIKELHPHLAEDDNIRSMFVDEAYLVSRIRHPNVVPLLDVVADREHLTLIMDYVRGISLFDLLILSSEAGERMPQPVAFAIACDLLAGLHAAHEARGESGELLGIVHRDVSPHNVIVGADGVARLLDFGIAWAHQRNVQETENGRLKGKLAYMAPEQFEERKVDRRADVYAAAIVLWEMLSGTKLFEPKDLPALVSKKLEDSVDKPSEKRRSVADSVDAVIMRALMKDPDIRFQTARDMLLTLERNAPRATTEEVAAWVERMACARFIELETLAEELFAQVERDNAHVGNALRQSVRPPPMVIQFEGDAPPLSSIRRTQPMVNRPAHPRRKRMRELTANQRAVASIAFGFLLGGACAFFYGSLASRGEPENTRNRAEERRLVVETNPSQGSTRALRQGTRAVRPQRGD